MNSSCAEPGLLPEAVARSALTEVMRALAAAGLNRGAAGNASLRVAEGLLITPTGVTPTTLTDERHVVMSLAGVPRAGSFVPSSEWRFHRDIYTARPEVGAIVHVHSPYATALACRRLDLPAFHYMVAIAGGDSVRCAEYATFGTQALSDAALTALADRRACLLANHGMITTGPTLGAARELAVALEDLAHQYCVVLSLGGAALLDAEEMQNIMTRFETYGRQPAR
jgi:L-fuculose-phosphate aldolase